MFKWRGASYSAQLPLPSTTRTPNLYLFIHPAASTLKNGTPRQTYRTHQTQWMDMYCDACAVPGLVIFIHWWETKLPLFRLFQFSAWTGPSEALWLLYVSTQNMNWTVSGTVVTIYTDKKHELSPTEYVRVFLLILGDYWAEHHLAGWSL